MNKTPNFDLKIKAILDATTPGERVCPISGKTWFMDESEIDRCRKWNVPPIDVEPFTRMKLMASWCSGVDLWWKPHALTEKPILSGQHPDAIWKVINDSEFYGEDWGEKFPLESDPMCSVFESIEEIARVMPIAAVDSSHSENTFGAGFIDCLNSFMAFGTWKATDAFYVFRNNNTERVVDGVCLEDCQDTFSSSMCVRVNRCVQAFDSIDCLNSAFIFDCRNCEDCFCSSNLRRRRFVFKNEQLSEEEYRRRMQEIDLSCTSTFGTWQKTFRELLISEAIFPEHNNTNATECSGDYLLDCLRSTGYFMTRATEIHNGWFSFDVENAAYLMVGKASQDGYMTTVMNRSRNNKYSFVTLSTEDCEYSLYLENCEHCFGCVGLRRKKFYIFNKPYSEEEYWKKLDEVKCRMLDDGEYGQVLPQRLSVRGVEIGFTSIAAPFTKYEIDHLDGLVLDPIAGMRFAPESSLLIKDAREVPDGISQVGEEWTQVQFEDKEEQRKFNVSARELRVRKEKGYPFPRRHFRARLIELFRQINSPERETVFCEKCAKQIEVGKNPMFSERKVYCYACYLKYLESIG